MKRKLLFPQINGILHGADYNPEQWLDRTDILEKDIEMMKKAGINSVTMGMFSWSALEPEEGKFDFSWLHRIADKLYENGIFMILGTPSGARPAWLDEKYPKAMRVDASGVRNHHGGRHNHCMSALDYRKKVEIINRRLAEEFAEHPGLLLWHISNEYGGACYCRECVKRFQGYLAKKFDHDIEKLNQAWWTGFWSHRYNHFEQIEPPYSNGENSNLGLTLEWKRFTSWNMTDFMKFEIETLRSVKKEIPVTTNFMTLYEGLDYREMAKELDMISWDSYPAFHNDTETLAETFSENAFCHALMRSMKPKQPFLMMESAPGLVSWQPYNKLRRPGIHKLAGLQAIASGSDTVQYFQWRKGRGSVEQFHGAVVDHLGTDDTRIFREVEELGTLLKKLSQVAGSVVDTKTAIIYDWDNRWAIDAMQGLSQETKQYDKTCISIWQELLKMGVEADVISQDDDWSKYKLVIAPMMYLLHDGTGKKGKDFVKNGGIFLATYLTGYVDKNQLCYLGGFPGDGLSELFGIVSEEIDTLYPADSNGICWQNGARIRTQVKDYAELLRVKDAEVLAVFADDFYAGKAAVTKKCYGLGTAYYVAGRIAAADMYGFLEQLLTEAEIPVKQLEDGMEYHVRRTKDMVYECCLNLTRETKVVDGICGKELLSGQMVEGGLKLEPYGAAVVAKPVHE